VMIAPGGRPPVSALRRTAGALLVFLLGGLLIAVRFGLWPGSAARSPVLGGSSLPTFGAVSPFMWDAVGGPPVPASVGAGPLEGFVGRIRMRGDDTLWIAAFEGSKLGLIWKAGPFGTFSEGYTSTFTSVVGRDVVVTDYRGIVHIYDLASGREARSLRLTDRAKSMCVGSDAKAHIWIEASDEKNVLVDADLGTLAPSPRPAWCSELVESSDCRGWLKRGPPRVGCKGPAVAPRVQGFETNNVLEDGEVAVALGRKHPGTRFPMAVGFDPKNKALRWQQLVASGDQANVVESSADSVMDAMAGGRFVAPYQLTSKGWHFTAFDARTGQRLWDVALQPLIGLDEPAGFTLSTARVYVTRSSSLEIYDARTGALVGTVGGV
jgi:outer membrane protein assembly factor BamB